MGKIPVDHSILGKAYVPVKGQAYPNNSGKKGGKPGIFNCFGKSMLCRAVSVEPMVPRGNRVESIDSGVLTDPSSPRFGDELGRWQEKVANINREMAKRNGNESNYSASAITELTLIGSHDSGTYTIKFPKLKKVPLLKRLVKKFRGYSVTQSKTFRDQLQSGARYLDLRARSSGTASGFRIHHGIINGTDFSPEFEQILTYAREHPKEMVVVKVQFDYDKGKSLDKFYKKFLKENKDLLVKSKDEKGKDRSLKDIRPGCEQGNIVLMTKDKNNHLCSTYDECWDYKTNTISHWVNTADSSALKKGNRELLERGAEVKDGKLIINQMQKTSLTTVHKDKNAWKPLDDQAESVNSKVDDWLVEWTRKNKSIRPNVICMDYFDEYEEGESVYLTIAYNLRDADDELIKKEFPETAGRIINSKKRLNRTEEFSGVVKSKEVVSKFKKKLGGQG